MRGQIDKQQTMFVAINVETRIHKNHPLRAIKSQCDRILFEMRKDFNSAYSHIGRPSIPPEQLLKALLLQALYSIRSEIQLLQAIEFNLLYRWFLDIAGDAEVWTPEVFSMNRRRFAEHDLVRKFFDRIVADAIVEDLVSNDHFTVDGTLIRSWASLKSLGSRNGSGDKNSSDTDKGNPTVNWHGQKRSNDTHVSSTDPEALLAKKGPGNGAFLSHSGHILMENRYGLCIDVDVDAADGWAERRTAVKMLKRLRRRHKVRPKTLGLDGGYDEGGFLAKLEKCRIVPHVPVRRGRIVATDAGGYARRRARRRAWTKGYAISQRVRKRVEEIFGWAKTIGGLARTRFVGRWRILQQTLITASAYNLLRIAKLRPAT